MRFKFKLRVEHVLEMHVCKGLKEGNVPVHSPHIMQFLLLEIFLKTKRQEKYLDLNEMNEKMQDSI
jgi:hypothetical protein